MTRKIYTNIFLTLLVLLMYPLLWRYHQKLHYKRFFDVDAQSLLLKTNTNNTQLSSPIQILQLLNANNIQAELSYKVVDPKPFNTLGRVITTSLGDIQVYQYESNKEAKKAKQNIFFEDLAFDPVIVYKNLLINNSAGDPNLQNFLQTLND